MENYHIIDIYSNFNTQIKNGLIYIYDIPDDLGALFRMENEQIYNFWMKNTFVSLDMIFMDSNFKVVGIITNTIPHDTSIYKIDKPSKYLIEIKHGYINKYNIQLGNIVIPNHIINDISNYRYNFIQNINMYINVIFNWIIGLFPK